MYVTCLTDNSNNQNHNKDGNYYLVDTARVFPPEAPSSPAKSYTIWFRLLRPELLRQLDVPLASDAFSAWQAQDPSWEQLNADVVRATQKLYDEIIPAYTQSLRAKLLGEKWAYFV